MANPEDVIEKTRSKKIFLNHLDTFQGRNIGKFLSQCIAGATVDKIEKDESRKLSGSVATDRKGREGYYEIVGTARDKEKPKPDFAKEIIQYDNKDQLYEYLVECDIIIYDITEDPDQISEAVWIISEMHADLEKIEKPKMFILISTCMTWGKTRRLDSDMSNVPFTEDDYRKRKPHSNFKEHINAEKTVLKLGKTNKAKLDTYVICSGLTYGAEENTFHYLFKSAWHNAPELICFGDGQNIVPTIHIRDLAAIIQHVVDGWSKNHYIIAKDNSQCTLENIVKAVSDNLGSKKVKYIVKEEAFMSDLVEQQQFEMLLVNLKMESLFVKDGMNISWEYESGMIENIKQLVNEYKESRNLRPLRAVILGPPASGKSTVAKQLCDFYKLHHIMIKDVIDEELERLKAITHPSRMDIQAEEDDTQEKMSPLQALEYLQEIADSREMNNDRIDDKYVITFLRNRLMSTPCQNQGFILDGYPKTISQAQELFGGGTTEKDIAEIDLQFLNQNILPEFVINLEATDSFLKRKVMHLNESVIRNTHNTEKGLTRRLREYWAVNTYDETVLNFFDELELHPEKIDVTKDKSKMMKDTVEKIKKIFGNPRNYGSTKEEMERIKKQEEDSRRKKEHQEKKEIERQEAEELQEKKRRQEDWSQRLHEVKKQEYELLEVQSIPLRNYLMKHVMPTLTQALMDCCKVRPDDPIDFLAEYLFQHNPQID